MFGFLKKQASEWMSPVKGDIIPMTDVPDQVFSSKMMGDGFAFVPQSNEVYSPFEGEVIKVFKTKHAILVKTKEALEVIIHIGIGTVELKGEGFEIHVEPGENIQGGQKLATVDFEYLHLMEKSIISPVIITNMEKVKAMDITYGPAEVNQSICKININ